MTFLIVIALIGLMICGYFYYQGVVSAKMAAPALVDGKIPVCGPKPNCVCSLQEPTDEHYIQPIVVNNPGIDQVVQSIKNIGGDVTETAGGTIRATFTTGIFRFVDDFVVQVDDGVLHVRSSSRVGHSDLGANRKRVERLREALS